uniref:Uncharacterized protein n=1 Tax=Globisporangium ultimum (strain ATCC 200006 / CBS 805.95 / DAOM BR144) TaxID=431595 RepID=K3WRB3_GLOUD
MPVQQDEPQHPPPAPSSLAGRSGSATSSPMAPPPPPPPPPPQFELEQAELLSKKQDFREILALFHDAKMDPQDKARAWEALWQTTLVEAHEEMKQQQTERKAGKSLHADDATPVRSGSMTSRHGPGSGPEPPKRPRQTSAADLEPNKVSRLNRVQQSRPKGGGSKLMQKLGGGR